MSSKELDNVFEHNETVLFKLYTHSADLIWYKYTRIAIVSSFHW